MANTFRNSLLADVGTSYTDIYTCPTGIKSIIIEVDVCNKTESYVTVDVTLEKASADYQMVHAAPVPVGGTLSVVSGQKIVLEGDDKIKIRSSANTSIDVICSILEDV